MQTRQLGTSDLRITPIGFGAWAVGGGEYAFGWGAQDDDESVAAIHRAVDLGVNWIDTAPVYGLGRSERVVGRALASLGSSRRPYVFTKCSLVWDEQRAITHTLKASSVRREVEASLQRLGCDVIDLMQIHWPTFSGPAPDIEEGWDTLLDLQRSGKVRHLGVSNFDVSQLGRLAGRGTVVSLQPPYSMLAREVEREILPYCLAHGIGTIVYSPMAAGLLSGTMTHERVSSLPSDDWRRRNPQFKEPSLTRNLRLVEELRRIGNERGVTPGAIAVAWALRHPAVTAAIVGFRRPDQLDGPLAAASVSLSDGDVAAIEAYLA